MIRSAVGELAGAFMLLTRLPVGRWVPGAPTLGRCVWAFPLVGAVVGAVGGAIYWGAWQAGMAPLLAAGWALAAMIILTGGLHEDGLADTADGFGGGATPLRKLEIMRDSRIGSFGVLALTLSLLGRAAAIGALERPGPVAMVLIVAAVVGRAGMVIPLLLLAPARSDGLGASVARPPLGRGMVGLCGAAALAVVCLPPRAALLAIGGAAAAALMLVSLARRQIGGYTGDVLGAGEVVIEVVVLSVAASAFGR